MSRQVAHKRVILLPFYVFKPLIGSVSVSERLIKRAKLRERKASNFPTFLMPHAGWRQEPDAGWGWWRVSWC